jgi:hypothetical protein
MFVPFAALKFGDIDGTYVRVAGNTSASDTAGVAPVLFLVTWCVRVAAKLCVWGAAADVACAGMCGCAGSSDSVFQFGLVPFTAIICTVSIRLALEATSHNIVFQLGTVACVLLWVLAAFIIDQLDADGILGAVPRLFGAPQFYVRVCRVF